MIIKKIFTEAWRFEMLVYTLYLHDIRDPNDPRSGLTLANLQPVCEQQQCASRGRVLAILGIMGIGGYLHRSRANGDGRVARLEPSEKFVAVVEGWNHLILEIVDAVLPDDALARSHDQFPRFGWEMRRQRMARQSCCQTISSQRFLPAWLRSLATTGFGLCGDTRSSRCEC